MVHKVNWTRSYKNGGNWLLMGLTGFVSVSDPKENGRNYKQ